MTKHFIDFDNHSLEVLQNIIDRAISLKKEHKAGHLNNSLNNKTLAMIFDNSSISGVFFNKASWRRILVRGVRKSWLTPANIVVLSLR